MPAVTNNLIDAFEFLLPGFLAAAIFSSLSVRVKVGGLVLVVYAFILTTVIQFVFGLLELLPDNWKWGSAWDREILVALAIFVGIVISVCWNNDFPHRILRRLNITRQSTHQSTLYSAFTRGSCYIVIHMGGRRLYGWPAEWPSSQEEQFILLEEPSWITETSQNNGTSEQSEISHMLIPLSEVNHIEFVEGQQQENQE